MAAPRTRATRLRETRGATFGGCSRGLGCASTRTSVDDVRGGARFEPRSQTQGQCRSRSRRRACSYLSALPRCRRLLSSGSHSDSLGVCAVAERTTYRPTGGLLRHHERLSAVIIALPSSPATLEVLKAGRKGRIRAFYVKLRAVAGTACGLYLRLARVGRPPVSWEFGFPFHVPRLTASLPPSVDLPRSVPKVLTRSQRPKALPMPR